MNTKLQFGVLYRQFLFRVFDLEVLSAGAQGDSNRLLGQFAALLIIVSVWISPAVAGLSDPNLPGRDPGGIGLVFLMIAQHFAIATTMLAVGLLAVLSWDATFPDKRDVLVLAPLPLRARTIFLAKVTAVATALGLTIVLLHSGMGLFLPAVFASRSAPAALPEMTFDSAAAPLPARDLKTVMDHDLKQALTTGELAPGTGAGLAIGVSKRGERRIFTYGAAKQDSLFQIASISKTFTGLILARMVEQGKVQLDEPVRQLLPPGTVTKPRGEEITLLDLATHHSGLPAMPGNFQFGQAWTDYGRQELYAYLKQHGVEKPESASFSYSNLGIGLLGQVLADRAGKTYGELLRDEITGPLGMTDTVVALPAGEQRRLLQGHDDKHLPVETLDLNGALAGAAAIHSTAPDMLAYLEANLHLERYPALSSALVLSHRLRERATGGQQIALAWAYFADTGTYWHNGATSGFTSHVFFCPREDTAVVVLMNRGPGVLVSVDAIADHIQQRLSGQPAISLNSVLVPATGGFRGVLRSYVDYWFTMLAAGVFIYGTVLGIQGLAALLLPRRLFLRWSGYLQLAAIFLILGVYFLQPGLGGLDDLASGSIFRVIQFLPSYWFLGLYQQLNGSMHPLLEPLAQRAWIALGSVLCLTPVIYGLSYWRTIRKIVEEPDILSGARRSSWLPSFGSRRQTAIGQFILRTLARSKQHRLIVGFYLGIGLAFTSLLLNGSSGAVSNPWREKTTLLWSASLMMIVLAAVGTRVAFALPLDLRANWIFQVIGVRGGPESLAASRRALLLLSVTPVWIMTALACLPLSPGRQSAGHVVALGLFGLILTDLCLLRFQKIPFACSYLPGRSRFHMAFLGAFVLLWLGSQAALFERHLLRHAASTALMIALLAIVWVLVRWTTVAMARSGEQELRFEEATPLVVQGLGLDLDGAMPLLPAGAQTGEKKVD